MNCFRRFNYSPLDERERNSLEQGMTFGHSVWRQHAERPHDIWHARLPRNESCCDRGKRKQRVHMNDIERLDVFAQPLTEANGNFKEYRRSSKIPSRCIWCYDRAAALHRQRSVVTIVIGRNSGDFNAARRQRTFDIDYRTAWSAVDRGNGWNNVEHLHTVETRKSGKSTDNLNMLPREPSI